MDQRRRLGDRLDDAGLVVCALQRQQHASGAAAGGLEPVEVEPAVGPQGRDLRRRKPMAGEDAGMLAGGDDEPLERGRARPGAEQRIERRVRGLGAAGDERDATGRHAREPRDVASRLLDDPARRPPFRVHGGGIAGRLHRRERGLARFRAQRRGGVIIEIGSG